MWFQGFVLTATPGKLGEFSHSSCIRAWLPASPLLHVFFAERLCDVAAVVIWLALLVPGQLQRRFWLLNIFSVSLIGFGVVLACVLCYWFWSRRSRWLQHLPSSRMIRACLPATVVSFYFWGLEAMLLWLLVRIISPADALNIGQAIGIYLLSGTAGMALYFQADLV